MTDQPGDQTPSEPETTPPPPPDPGDTEAQPPRGDAEPIDATEAIDAARAETPPAADATVQIPRQEPVAADPVVESDPAPAEAAPTAPATAWPPEEDPEEKRRGWLPIVGALALFTGLVLGWLLWGGGADAEELQSEVDRLTAENADLSAQVDVLTADLEDAGSGAESLEELQARNEELTAQVETLSEQVEGLTTDNETLTEQVVGLEEQNAQLEERIEEIMADVDAAVVAAPDVVGGTVDAATSTAQENGWLLVQIPTATAGVSPGTVVAQSPPSGTPMLSGSVLVVSVAAAPEPAPDPGLESVFEADGSGPTTTDAVELPGGTRLVLAYSFTGEGRHTVSVVDADGDPVAVLVDVNGTAEGATALPLAGSYRLQVDTADGVDWTLKVVALP